MNSIFLPKTVIFIAIFICSEGCAYYNTFYNAQQYYEEAERFREGEPKGSPYKNIGIYSTHDEQELSKFIDKVISGNYKVPKIVDQLKINKDCRFIDEI